jgi:hypothetical protein
MPIPAESDFALLGIGASPLPLPAAHGIICYGWPGGGAGWFRED